MIDHCHCGCCDGTHKAPIARDNAPGLAEVQYRAGTHGSFKAALLAALSQANHPALSALRTRADDDFTVATCDAAATLLDVLTFYQERYANELYLRTATERRSLIDLARLLGYQASPGVAATTRLAFLLEDAPGARALAAEPVTVAIGTRVQSVPGPDEQPQTFETVEPVTARVGWNAIPVQATERQTFATGTTELHVAGVTVPLQSGDVVLVVGDERLLDEGSDIWDARVVTAVMRDNVRDATRLALSSALGATNPARAPSSINPRAYVFRQRTALFGHNAPDANLLFHSVADTSTLPVSGTPLEWNDFALQNTIDLEGSHPKALRGSWVLLAGGDGDSGLASLPGLVALYRAERVQHRSRSAFAVNGRVTAITPDTDAHLEDFPLRIAAAFAQSEELALASRPLDYPLYGARLALGRIDFDLVRGQELAVSGKRQRLQIVVDDSALALHHPDGSATALRAGDSFVIVEPPARVIGSTEIALTPARFGASLRVGTATLRLRLLDRNEKLGTLDAVAAAVALQPARDDDPVVRELCTIAATSAAITHDRDRTTLALASPLLNVYDRTTTTVCGNIARATHGETVSEVAGSGNAATAGQRFQLKQAPLTYISALTPEGRASTLAVRVEGVLWHEAPMLFERGPTERTYALRQDADGNTIVQFGDGVEGQRLPTGVDNVRLTYRKYLGRAGNLPAGRLTTLLGRPLGVKLVSQVTPATGGEDPESLEDLRSNAPLTMLTLGRAVSLHDYTAFARGFAGIAKAQATWMGSTPGRGVLVTVAGPDGEAVGADSGTRQHLLAALRAYGDPVIPLAVVSYAPVRFCLSARIKVAADAEHDVVRMRVREALQQAYAFDRRAFDQHVTLDEVMAVVHRVSGVEAVDVDGLYRLDPGATPAVEPRLYARPAQWPADGDVSPAELLLLDTASLSLAVMS